MSKEWIREWASVVFAVLDELDKEHLTEPPTCKDDVALIARYMNEWALYYTTEEIKTWGHSLSETVSDEELAVVALRRWYEWSQAYLLCFRYSTARDFPDFAKGDGAMFSAALAARMASSQATANHPAVLEFYRRATEFSPAVWEKFHSELHKPRRNRPPRHPELNEWLILVWPIVYVWNWSYLDLLVVAEEQFSDLAGKYPLTTEDDLRKHCGDALRGYLLADPRYNKSQPGRKQKRRLPYDELPERKQQLESLASLPADTKKLGPFVQAVLKQENRQSPLPPSAGLALRIEK